MLQQACNLGTFYERGILSTRRSLKMSATNQPKKVLKNQMKCIYALLQTPRCLLSLFSVGCCPCALANLSPGGQLFNT